MEIGLKMGKGGGDAIGRGEKAKTAKIGMEETETELRLGIGIGLPAAGGGAGNNSVGEGGDQVVRKRGFSETVDLKLNLSSKDDQISCNSHVPQNHNLKALLNHTTDDPSKPPAAKAQVVGWPPVRSFRKNMLACTQKSSSSSEESEKGGAAFVKVSMDGAPYLRKVDLRMYKTYQELSDALAKMFSSFTIGNCGSQGMKDFMNESKLMDLLNGSDYVPTYEDKDGDWMLVGDVPWEMFVESCKRLRIMKGTEAIGLAPRAMEKCKHRS